MIRLEINVITINQKFEFNLDEDTKVGVLEEEICSIISTKTNQKWEKSPDQINISDRDLRSLLPKSKTLRECGVKNGHELIMY